MNKVILMGRLTRDPDIRYSQGENSVAVARFTLAVDRRFKRDGEQSADFISCVAFGRNAEFFEKYTKQGTKLVIEGNIRTGSYTNRDGQKVYTTDVAVDSVEFAESKASASSAPAQSEYTAPAARPMPEPSEAASEGFMNIADGLEDEGLPFN
jgi:single-strand DNA-binding protein